MRAIAAGIAGLWLTTQRDLPATFASEVDMAAELAKTDLWKVVQRNPSRARFPGGESIAEPEDELASRRKSRDRKIG